MSNLKSVTHKLTNFLETNVLKVFFRAIQMRERIVFFY